MDKLNISDISFFSLSGFNTWARLCNVIDGDTMICILPFPNNESFHKFYVRLNGIDTCELKSQDTFLHSKAIAAKNELIQNICHTQIEFDQLQDYLKSHSIQVWLKCHEFDKYGRLLASVHLSPTDTISLSELLISKKLAYSYSGSKKPTDEELRKILSS